MGVLMDLSGLLAGLLLDPAFARAARADGPHGSVVTPDAAIPFLAAGMARHRLVLAVTATTRQAEDLAAAASSLTGSARVAVLPAWETLPHERLSPSSDTVGRRLAVLRRLAHPDPHDETIGALDLVVAPIRALLQPIVQGLGDLQPVVVRPGDEIAHEDLAEALVAIGYAGTDLVEKRGQFAIRGGILDVFPPTEEHPLRVEFWGDDVEEIRYFRVADQRSLEVARHGLWAPPCRELLLTPAVRERAAELAERHAQLTEMCAKLAEGIVVEGMEALAPVLADGMESLVEALARASSGESAPLVLLCDPELVRTKAHDLVARATSSSPRPGTTPLSATRPRSTWALRPTGPSRRSARPLTALGSPGGPPARSASSAPMTTPTSRPPTRWTRTPSPCRSPPPPPTAATARRLSRTCALPSQPAGTW